MSSEEIEECLKKIEERLEHIEEKIQSSQDHTWAVGIAHLWLVIATFGIAIITAKVYYTGFARQIDVGIMYFLFGVLLAVVFLFSDIIELLIKFKQWHKQWKGISISDTYRFLRRLLRKKP